MRIWHIDLLPYLPDRQFRGQLRELVYILHAVQRSGTPNHILVNFVTEYPPGDLTEYFHVYADEYQRRYGKPVAERIFREFDGYADRSHRRPFPGQMDRGYLDICLSNLYEKHRYGRGGSRISDSEYRRLCDGYQSAVDFAF